jgi:signal transduction histidine kinase
VLVGLHPQPCTRTDEAGVSTADTRLEELVALAATGGAEPVVSQILDVPGDCRSAVAIALASGPLVTVVLGDVGDATSRLAAGSLITDTAGVTVAAGSDPAVPAGGTRLMLITGDIALEPRLGLITVPPRVAAFARQVEADGPQRARYRIGEGSDAEVLAASAPVRAGWSVVLEQDAAIFDIELQNRPSLIVASVLTVVFAVVFGLLAFFDIRRRRAHRRAEVAKNAFFSIAGHELRTPLTVIKGFAEALSSNWSDMDEERRRTLVERIVPQTRRLDKLVERLLVAASIQSETHSRPQIQGFDPLPALEQVAERFRPEAPLHSFVVAGEPGLPYVQADPRAFEQILEHLVDNAVKYSPSGGTIWLSLMSDQRRVHVVVEDEGVGLASDHRHIFDKFVQGESVTKRVHDEGGVGLGLYIVRTLLEEMGGSVRAEPRSPDGARFIVSLKPAPRTDRLPTTPPVSGGLVRSDHD